MKTNVRSHIRRTHAGYRTHVVNHTRGIHAKDRSEINALKSKAKFLVAVKVDGHKGAVIFNFPTSAKQKSFVKAIEKRSDRTGKNIEYATSSGKKALEHKKQGGKAWKTYSYSD